MTRARTKTRIHGIAVLAAVAIVGGALVAVTSPGARAGAATGGVYVVGPNVFVQPTNLAGTGPTTATLTAAQNEYESFQIVVKGGASPLAINSVTVSALSGAGTTIPAANVTVAREAHYTVTTPSDGELGLASSCGAPSDCRFPDALIPEVDPWYHENRNAFPTTIPANENRVIWVDVRVPAGQRVGAYKGTVKVSTGSPATVTTVTTNLRVLPVALPSTSSLGGAFQFSNANVNNVCIAHFGSIGGCTALDGADAGSGQWKLYSLYVQAALDDRVSLAPPGAFGFDATSPSQAAYFRTYPEKLLAGSQPQCPATGASPIPCTHLAGAKLTAIPLNAFQMSAAGAAAFKTEAVAQGFADRVSFYCDEPGTSAAAWSTCQTNDSSRSTAWGTNPPLLSAYFGAGLGTGEALAWARQQGGGATYPLASNFEILSPTMTSLYGYNNVDNRALYDDTKYKLWTYTTCASVGCSPADPGNTQGNPWNSAAYNGWPSYDIDQPASEARAMAWQLFSYKLSGEFYYDVSRDLSRAWGTCAGAIPTNCQYSDGGNGDGTLFYPGTPLAVNTTVGTTVAIGGSHDIPIESIRLKRIRDGREDYELLKVLKDAGREADARCIVVGGAGCPATLPLKGLFPTMNQSNVAQTTLDTAREELICAVEAQPCVVNGGFERGLTAWTGAGTASISATAQAGTGSLQLGSSAPSTDSTRTQTFAMPSQPATVNLYYRITCPDVVANDWFTVTLHDNGPAPLVADQTLLAKTCKQQTAFAKVSKSFSNLKGHSVTLTFTNHDNGVAGTATSALVDTVSVVPNPILNPGFDSGLTSWTPAGNATASATVHTGAGAALLGSSVPTATDSSVAQSFTVPRDAAILSLYSKMTCGGTVASDWLEVTLFDWVTATTTTVQAKKCATTGWVKTSKAISALAGHLVTVTVKNHDDGVAGTASSTLVDDLLIT
jgi:hypothetical protein